MRPLLVRLAEGEILVSDGATGTMLFERGLDPGDCPERMTLGAPDVLTEVAGAYLEAGAEFVHTNTFGGSLLKLADYDLQASTEELNRKAVSIARDAVGENAYVAASVGPCGKILEPYGEVAEEAVYESFERQLKALASEGVDCVTVETMTDLREAVLAVRAAKSVMSGTPVLCTMTFDETPKGFFTIMGVDIPQAVEGLGEAGADVVGSNCGYGIEHMVGVAASFREATDLPILIHSNAGTPEMKDGALIFPESPAFFAEKTEALVDAGVSIVGGCCGTTPEYIRAIRQVVDRRNEQRVSAQAE